MHESRCRDPCRPSWAQATACAWLAARAACPAPDRACSRMVADRGRERLPGRLPGVGLVDDCRDEGRSRRPQAPWPRARSQRISRLPRRGDRRVPHRPSRRLRRAPHCGLGGRRRDRERRPQRVGRVRSRYPRARHHRTARPRGRPHRQDRASGRIPACHVSRSGATRVLPGRARKTISTTPSPGGWYRCTLPPTGQRLPR